MTPQISSGIDSAEIINFASIADDQVWRVPSAHQQVRDFARATQPTRAALLF